MSKSWNYRQELIKNADNTIRLNQSNVCIEHPTFAKDTHKENTPFLYTSCVDNARPAWYENTDMKENYLAIRQKQSVMMAPEIHLK